MLQRLADRIVLRPSRHKVPTDGKQRHWVEAESGPLEVWRHRVGVVDGASRSGPASEDDVDIFLLKFSGTGGRAECSTDQPADCWRQQTTEIWSVNPPGYGASSGRASLPIMAAAATSAFDAIAREAAGRPLFVAGNSLGGAYALHLAATRSFDGVVVRNPPPLRALIRGRFGWRSLWVGAELIARRTPPELDCIVNAAGARMPAVFVLSQRDRVVPPKYQHSIVDAYAGDKRVLRLAEAGHACPLEEPELRQYAEHLDWLRREARRRSDEAVSVNAGGGKD